MGLKFWRTTKSKSGACCSSAIICLRAFSRRSKASSWPALEVIWASTEIVFGLMGCSFAPAVLRLCAFMFMAWPVKKLQTFFGTKKGTLTKLSYQFSLINSKCVFHLNSSRNQIWNNNLLNLRSSFTSILIINFVIFIAYLVLCDVGTVVCLGVLKTKRQKNTPYLPNRQYH